MSFPNEIRKADVFLKDCSLCHTQLYDIVNLGEIFTYNGKFVHYLCVLLSKAVQAGEDDEGLFGFLLDDIDKEIERCQNLVCVYCNKKGAFIKCNKRNCQVQFHLPCGQKNGSVSVFQKQFPSLCCKHRSKQFIPNQLLERAKKSPPECIICFETLNVSNRNEILLATCCQSVWFHRYCIAKYALSSASSFKCPICSNYGKFKNAMIRCGIYVPEGCASWESEIDTSDSSFRYRCDAATCFSDLGREIDVCGTVWEIIICNTCGSEGTHVRCGRLKFHATRWECCSCNAITSRMS